MKVCRSKYYLSLFQNRALAPLQIPASLCEGPIYLLLCWVIILLLKSTRWRAHCHLHSLLLVYIGYDLTGSLLPWITMFSQSLIFKGALHLCFAVSERASEIPSCYIILWLFWESVVIRDLLLLLASWLCYWYEWLRDLRIITNVVSYNLCWKLECWLYIFTTTRANRVCKSFSLSLSVYQLNCLRTSKGLSLGELIRIQRICFSFRFSFCFWL